jgi:tyrosinase
MANGTPPYVRYEVRSPAGEQALQAYANAVAEMKERSDEDPTSWAYQAGIHGAPAITHSLWDQCKHWSWFFFPWHRIYLYYFERIVRKAVVDGGGPADWALPYWNYGLGGEHAKLPPPFREPANAGNPLFAERKQTYNEGEELPLDIRKDTDALARPNFIGNAEFGGSEAPGGEGFWGRPGAPEMTPHGGVHTELGGWMRNPDTAALDPIFWLHHANMDRIWAVWSEREDPPPGANPEKSDWLTESFEFFDENGNPDGKSVQEVVETIPYLKYTYDPSPAGIVVEVPPAPEPSPDAPPPPAEPKFVGASEEIVPLEGEPVEVPVEIDPRAREEVLEAADPEDPRRLYLNVEDIVGESNPETVYGIYLNLSPDPDPELLQRRYLGNLSFFGIDKGNAPSGDEHPHGLRVSVEAGPLIRELRDETDWDRERLEVWFRPIMPASTEAEPGYERHPPVRIGRISLAIDA